MHVWWNFGQFSYFWLIINYNIWKYCRVSAGHTTLTCFGLQFHPMLEYTHLFGLKVIANSLFWWVIPANLHWVTSENKKCLFSIDVDKYSHYPFYLFFLLHPTHKKMTPNIEFFYPETNWNFREFSRSKNIFLYAILSKRKEKKQIYSQLQCDFNDTCTTNHIYCGKKQTFNNIQVR